MTGSSDDVILLVRDPSFPFGSDAVVVARTQGRAITYYCRDCGEPLQASVPHTCHWQCPTCKQDICDAEPSVRVPDIAEITVDGWPRLVRGGLEVLDGLATTQRRYHPGCWEGKG